MSNNDKILNALARLAVAEDSTEAARAKAEIKGLMKGGETATPAQENKPDITTELAIRKALKDLGMPEHIKGFRFALEAIRLCVEDEAMIDMITKRLYPEVAKRCDSTPSRVERAIRHGIDLVWERCSIENLYEYFGYSISPNKGKSTNSEFIAKVSGVVRLQMKANT